MKKTILIIGLFIFIGCSKDDDIDRVQSSNLIINFTHTVGTEPLVMHPWGMCSQPIGEDCEPGHTCCAEDLNYINLAGDQYNIQTLMYLISNINLHSADGSVKFLKEVHFVDLEDASTLEINTGVLDNGSYSKITFTMGLEASLNVDNKYLNEDWDAQMEWPMNFGYHYMKLEGAYDTIINRYNTHTGPTMGVDRSFNQEIPISINVNDNLGDVNVFVNMELNNWYQNPNTISFNDYPNGMMADTLMQHKLQANGEADVFTLSTR